MTTKQMLHLLEYKFVELGSCLHMLVASTHVMQLAAVSKCIVIYMTSSNLLNVSCGTY